MPTMTCQSHPAAMAASGVPSTPEPEALQLQSDVVAALMDLTDDENELYEQGDRRHIIPGAAKPVTYQKAQTVVRAGGAGCWSIAQLQGLREEDLFKEAMQVDAPCAYHKSFRRLTKKAAVPVHKRIGRVLQQFQATGKVACKVDDLKDLVFEAETGQKPEKPGQGFWRQQCIRRIQQACITSVRRLVRAQDKTLATKEVRTEALRLAAACTADSGQNATRCLPLVLHAAQQQMYKFAGRAVQRKPLPSGFTFDDADKAKQQSIVQPAAGYLITGWTRFHEEPELAAIISATASDEELVQKLQSSRKLAELFAGLTENAKAMQRQHGWQVCIVKLEVGMKAKERGHLHYHIYVGATPATGGYLGAEDEHYYAKPFHLEAFAVGGSLPNVRRCATRNGKGVRTYLEGAIYYCMANKLGSLLCHSDDIVLWEDGFCTRVSEVWFRTAISMWGRQCETPLRFPEGVSDFGPDLEHAVSIVSKLAWLFACAQLCVSGVARTHL